MASAAASETFRFKQPYKMADHVSSENGINFIDGHIDYRELQTVLNEAVAGFAPLRLRHLEMHIPRWNDWTADP